jgi:transposase
MSHRSTELRKNIARLDSTVKEYKTLFSTDADRKGYDAKTELRLRTCFSELHTLVEEATSSIIVAKHRGAKSLLTLEKKVMLILIKQIFSKSNRNMSFMLLLFSALDGIVVSYKTIERLYSDQYVKLAIMNLFVLTLRKRGIAVADAVADGTGYTVFVGEHYATAASQLKEKAKDSKKHNKKIHYFFAIMDIKTRLYVGYGSSFRCEQDAFRQALKATKQNEVDIERLRIDRLFSAESYCNECRSYFGKLEYITIPKKNIAHFGVGAWCKMLLSFMKDTFGYLKTYFQRNQAESGFAEDKKRTGWRILQKRDDRIEVVQDLIALWHNLSWTWVM